MTTLANAILEVARVVTHLREGTTTAAGSTTTLVDTTQDEPDDFWNNGLVWFLTGALAGKTAVPSDYVKSTGTITLPTQTAAPGSGSRYAVIGAEYSRSDLVKAVNLALDDMKNVPQEDTDYVVADQEEYSLSTGVQDVRRVYTGENDADPYTWHEHFWWEETADGILRFTNHIPDTDDQPIRIVYCAPHTEVVLDADVISSYIPIERIKWGAAVNALRSRYGDVGKDAPIVTDRLKDAMDRELRAKNRNPIKAVERSMKLSGW